QSEAEDVENDASQHLIGSAFDRDVSKHHTCQSARQECRGETEPRVARRVGHQKSADGAYDHHALDTDVQYAGALRDRFPKRCEQNWSGDADRCRNQRGEEGKIYKCSYRHDRLSTPEPRSDNRMKPSMTHTNETGTPTLRCIA